MQRKVGWVMSAEAVKVRGEEEEVRKVGVLVGIRRKQGTGKAVQASRGKKEPEELKVMLGIGNGYQTTKKGRTRRLMRLH